MKVNIGQGYFEIGLILQEKRALQASEAHSPNPCRLLHTDSTRMCIAYTFQDTKPNVSLTHCLDKLT